MAYQEDIALMAHLMRRAGFGAGRDELGIATTALLLEHARTSDEAKPASQRR